MVKDVSGFQWEKKDKFYKVDYPKEITNSGDLIFITRFDGVDQLI